NHTLVLIDGIEVNDPSSASNAFDFSSLLVDNIERIEIIRGPQSTLYGSDAMAGIVNIFSKTGNQNRSINIFSETGTNNHLKGSISAAGQFSFINYALNFSRLQTDGISAISSDYGNTEKDKYENISASANLIFSIDENTKFNAIYRYVNTEAGLDQSNKFGDDPNYFFNIESHLLRGALNFNSFANKIEHKVSVSLTRQVTTSRDDFDAVNTTTASRYNTNATRLKYEILNNFKFFENHNLILGAEAETEKAITNYYSEGMWGPYESNFPLQSKTNYAMFLQDQMKFFNNLFITSGIRYDNYEDFGNVITYRIAPAYLISQTKTKLKFTYGTGFKSPSLYYLFDPMFGNPNLKPEKSYGWDAGFEQYLFSDKITLGATYFQNTFNDMIGFDAMYKAINIDKAETNGIEISANLKNLSNFEINTHYTYTIAKDKSPTSPDFDLPLLRRPAHKFVLSINYKPIKKINTNLIVTHVGERDDKDFSAYPVERVRMKNYTLVDLSLAYEIMKNIELKGRIENLLDTKYEEVLFYGTPGRCFYGGFNLNL
ncbi:MAG: TonB-dependent receptor, partial [Ignavibacteriales bacterium]|nr:TonB-dependent receptor [Ignavibacteriales bacterium]